MFLLFGSILQTPAAYVPLDPEAPGLSCARVITQCGIQYCAVKTDLLQVVWSRIGAKINHNSCKGIIASVVYIYALVLQNIGQENEFIRTQGKLKRKRWQANHFGIAELQPPCNVVYTPVIHEIRGERLNWET